MHRFVKDGRESSMSAITFSAVPAPWPGYLEASEESAIDLLERKVQGAKDLGDRAYALALTSAVACYEGIRRDGGEHRAALRTRAERLHVIVLGWIGS